MYVIVMITLQVSRERCSRHTRP